MSFLLPGDLIGHCYQPQPLAASSVVTLTEVVLWPAPPADCDASLGNAYGISHALDEAFLLAQITRFGRMNAYERLADLFLELFERLSMADRVQGNSFAHPMTQEIAADVSGLTAVHVNRTLKAMRHNREADWSTGLLGLHDPAALAARIGWTPFNVSAAARSR